MINRKRAKEQAMATYRVFEFPNALAQAVADGDNVRLVRDGFSVLALLFPVLWLLWHRLWLELVVYIIFLTAFSLSQPVLGIVMNALLGLYVAFEGTNFLASKLTYHGWNEVDLVLAGNVEEAEARAFSRRTLPAKAPVHVKPDARPVVSPPVRPLQKKRQVIGTFSNTPSGSRS